jgi:hypothetical protein
VDTFSVRLTEEGRAARQAAAERKGVPEAEMIRQLVRRGLALQPSDGRALVVRVPMGGTVTVFVSERL